MVIFHKTSLRGRYYYCPFYRSCNRGLERLINLLRDTQPSNWKNLECNAEILIPKCTPFPETCQHSTWKCEGSIFNHKFLLCCVLQLSVSRPKCDFHCPSGSRPPRRTFYTGIVTKPEKLWLPSRTSESGLHSTTNFVNLRYECNFTKLSGLALSLFIRRVPI